MRRVFLFTVVMVCAATMHAQREYRVTGEDYQQTTRVYMKEVGDSVVIDSANVHDGKFTFVGRVEGSKFVELVSKEGNSLGQFVLEPGTVTLYGRNYYGRGAPLNDAFVKLVDELGVFEKMVREGKMSKDDSYNIHMAKVVELVSAHLGDGLGARAFYYFNYYVEKSTFKVLFDCGGPMIRKVPGLVSVRENYELTAKTEECMMFTDFSVEYDGRVHRLSDYVGKGHYVLIDFWASWCGPCKAEIPNIIEAYNKYKDRGFVVVGIPVNDKPEDTQKAMEELGITYPQIRDIDGAASTPYGVAFIPQIILFGPDGTILRRGLRGEEIMKTVSEYMERK